MAALMAARLPFAIRHSFIVMGKRMTAPQLAEHAVVQPALDYSNLFRVNATELRIRLPAKPNYLVSAPETLQLVVPASALLSNQTLHAPPIELAATGGLAFAGGELLELLGIEAAERPQHLPPPAVPREERQRAHERSERRVGVVVAGRVDADAERTDGRVFRFFFPSAAAFLGPWLLHLAAGPARVRAVKAGPYVYVCACNLSFVSTGSIRIQLYRSRNPRLLSSRVLVRSLSSTGIVINLGLLGLLWYIW